jgi:RNA methyltransferase, TrmH family
MIKDEENTSTFNFQAHKNIVRPIAGLKEPIIKSLRKVKTSGGRAKEGLYLAEGADLCFRAVHYGAEVVALICADGYVQQDECIQLRNLLPKGTPIYSCSEGMLHKCLEAKPTPPCVALVQRSLKLWSPSASFDTQPTLYLGVDRGDNADNLGMLLRTAEAAGVTEVLLSGGTVDPWGRRVVRASRGAMFSLPLSVKESSFEAVKIAQEKGIQIITTSARATANYTEVDYRLPSLLMVGNEHEGIDENVVKASDHCVLMPMLGHIHSLNIAVAASLILYEAQRQRGWISAR